MNNSNWKFFAGCALPIILIVCFCSAACFGSFLLLSSAVKATGDISSDEIKEKYLSGVNPLENPAVFEKDKIAVINIAGEISYSVAGDTAPEIGATSGNIIKQIKKASEDNKVKAIILRLNTPGGATLAGQPICDAIKSSNKPVYAFSDSAAASLGYYIANCTKYIFGREMTTTGSIGVIAQAMDLTGILTNLGARTTTITNTKGSEKTGEGIFDPKSDTYKMYQKFLDEAFDDFVNQVVEGRTGKLTRDGILALADGRIFSGKQAFELKLIDELAEFDQVVSRIVEMESLSSDNLELVEYYLPEDPFANFLPGFSSELRTLNQVLNNENKIEILFK